MAYISYTMMQARLLLKILQPFFFSLELGELKLRYQIVMILLYLSPSVRGYKSNLAPWRR